MTKCAPGWRLFPCLLVAFFLVSPGVFTGCSQFKRAGLNDEKDPHYLEGQRRAAGKDWDGAIGSYERALQSNPKNAAAHRELGIINYEVRNDYPAAIYHYQRYLKLDPNSSVGQIIRSHIEYSKRAIARTGGITPGDREVQFHLERMNATNEFLRKRIDFLEDQIARGPMYVTNYVTQYVRFPEFQPGTSRILTRPAELVRAPAVAQPEPEPEAASEPPARMEPQPRRDPPPVARETRREPPPRNTGRGAQANNNRSEETTGQSRTKTHRVRPGETTAILARNYGVSVSALRAANPGIARGVRAGQVIKIPAK